jgi:hypothetical protein
VILLVRNETVAYVQANPSASVQWSGTLAVGAEIGVELELIPRSRTSYVDDSRVLVDARSRTVIWIG